MFDAIAGGVMTFADFVSAVTGWVVARLRGEPDLVDAATNGDAGR